MHSHTEKIEKIEKIEKVGTFFRFEDLRIYHKSLDYITWVQDVTMMFPPNDPTEFSLRFNDSARNIALFIAEGSARNKSQFVYYLKMAKSAIRECLVFTMLAKKQSYISDLYDEESRNHLMEMTKMIGALISSLQRAGGNNSNGNGGYNYAGKGNNGAYKPNYHDLSDASNSNLHDEMYDED